MKKYKQLNHEERVTIKVCLWHKMSIRQIAEKMKRSPSTISREIKRGITIDGTYFAESTEIYSITYDNGCEFAGHEDVNKMLHCKSYFCNPYHSWEKGTVENINGLIRRFLPKGTDFDTVSEEYIQHIENWINNRSMKILNWKSPNEIFNSVAL